MRVPALTLSLCLLGLFIESDAAETNAVVKEIAPGIMQMGAVRIDQKSRSLSFPATVNMKEGAIEYLLVAANGKLHESVFKTDAEPVHIHAAALLLDKNTVSNKVAITITHGQKSLAAGAFIRDIGKDAPIQDVEWRYSGSRIIQGVFIAHRDGSIVSVIDDPDALVESLHRNRQDDENWQPVSSQLPEVGQEVTVTLKFSQKE